MTEKTQIDLGFVLPNVPDARDSCVGRLIDLIEAKEGIDTAHLLAAGEDRPDGSKGEAPSNHAASS